MLVIFDLDGTLLNTIADLAAATNYALSECGFPVHSPEAYPYYVGNGVKKLMERVLPEDSRNAETVDRMLKHFRDYYGEHLTDHTLPYQGIPELLDALNQKGIDVAVASNKYDEAVNLLISHFFGNIHWAAIEGQKEGIPTKPDPSIVFEILSKNPTPKADVLFVGDSGVDMTTAARAGVESVGVSWGFRPVKELTANYADNIIDRPDQLIQIIERKLNNRCNCGE